MPRRARIAIAGLAYHVTHRGNRRGRVFFGSDDRDRYLRWLAAAAQRHGVSIWAYCLMTNHIHLLVYALRAESLAGAMRDLQGFYARKINQRRRWSGHLWANRYYSNPVEPDRVNVVARYIESNPVRAGIVGRAEEFPWSSARAHCGLEGPGILAWDRPLPGSNPDWASWLASQDRDADAQIRCLTPSGRPIGSDEYCQRLEQELGRTIRVGPRGRPRSSAELESPCLWDD